MIKNYFITAVRTLARNKLYTVLNVAGLTFGLSCFLLIGLYLFDELTFDNQHKNAGRIFRAVSYKTENGESSVIAAIGAKLGEESKKTIPGVENTTRIQRAGRANILNTENPTNFFQETVTVADNNFLQIFDFPLLAGDKKTALQEPNSMVITESLAMKLFNSTAVVGKTLRFSFMEPALTIKAVLKNHPHNSSFDFSSVLSDATLMSDTGYRNMTNTDWLANNFSVYMLLQPQANAKSIAGKMADLVRANTTPPAGVSFSYSLQPLQEIHLHSEGITDGGRNSNVDPIAKGNAFYIKVFSFVAFFMLLIAGINYMNLTTARASSRFKEIGVRKTIGASQGNLTKQFLLESLLVTFISFLLSIGVVNLVLPLFNNFTGKHLSLGFSSDYRIWLYAGGFAITTGLLSGSYPALMLSRFKSILLLKGFKLQNSGDLSLRKGLVIFQFTISVIMIIATIVLFLQVRFLNNTNLGFNKELLVVIDINTGKARSDFESVKTEMAKIPSVKNVSVTSRVPGEWKSFRSVKIKQVGSAGDPKVAFMIGADKDFLQTFQIPLLRGRNFDNRSDSSSIIINETAAKMLNITEATGQLIEIPEFSANADGSFDAIRTNNGTFKPRVIGIAKDFHFQSLRFKIEPLVLAYNHNPIQVIDYYSARIAPTKIAQTLEQLKSVMVKNDSNDPFEYHFLNDQLALFYIEDGRRQTILIFAALATIFIACLGLFGLATYAAEQRIKEIGVRKVLGASVYSLASLLSFDFLKLVFIANGIAFPVAWWATNKWLQEYSYHVNVQWWVFVIAGVLATGIALITISYQSVKAAMANPVKSLRTE